LGLNQQQINVCSGTAGFLNVVAAGAGITYQWRKGTTILTNGGSISGATATLTINQQLCRCSLIIGNRYALPLTSNNAALVVNQVVAITAQP
jgi:hypothetical protein